MNCSTWQRKIFLEFVIRYKVFNYCSTAWPNIAHAQTVWTKPYQSLARPLQVESGDTATAEQEDEIQLVEPCRDAFSKKVISELQFIFVMLLLQETIWEFSCAAN